MAQWEADVERKDVRYGVITGCGFACKCFSCGTWRELTEAVLFRKNGSELPCPNCGMNLFHAPIVAKIKEPAA